MQECQMPAIKRRQDGSIDTAHYMKIGRQKRADQARILAKKAMLKPKTHTQKFLSIWTFQT